MSKKNNVLLAIGAGLTVLLVCGVFIFAKMHTLRLPADADMILIRNGTTGESFQVSPETAPDVFNELISIELERKNFSPFTTFSMGYTYILTYYKDGEAITELIGKGGICQIYKFPFYYNTSDDITSIIGRYLKNVDKTEP